MLKYFLLGLGFSATIFFLLKKNSDNLKKNGKGITQYLMSLGYSKSIASGIAGNLYVESKFDPLAVGDNGQSFGLAQWHKTRWDALKNWSKERNKSIADFRNQLDFIHWELNNTEKRALSKLLETKNPKDAAFVFAKYYERPFFISEERMNKAKEIYNSL